MPDWSGGTRIGQALKTFNYEWARRVLRRGAVVLPVHNLASLEQLAGLLEGLDDRRRIRRQQRPEIDLQVN